MAKKLSRKKLDKIALEDGFPEFVGVSEGNIRIYLYNNGNEDVKKRYHRTYDETGKTVGKDYVPKALLLKKFQHPINSPPHGMRLGYGGTANKPKES